MELALWDRGKMRETSALQMSDRKNMARNENWEVEMCFCRTPTTYIRELRSAHLGCIVFSPSSPSTRRTQHLDSPIVDLPLPSIYVSPAIHTTVYITFSPESLVLSDLLLPNLALLWTFAYQPVLFQGLSGSRSIVSPSAKVPYLLGVM